MATTSHALAENPKAALERYIVELQTKYYPWYERAAARHSVMWAVGQGVAIGAGVLASIVAAGVTQETFAHYGFVKTMLVALPLIGTTSSSLVAQTRVRDLLAVRERGRERLQALISRAEADYANAGGDDPKLATVHLALVEEVSKLEREQSLEFFTVAPGEAARSTAESQQLREGRERKTHRDCSKESHRQRARFGKPPAAFGSESPSAVK